jgi:hypothetical protein
VGLAAGLARRLRLLRRCAVLAAFDPRPLVLPGIETRAGHRALLTALSVLRAAPGRAPGDLLGHVEPRLVRGSAVILITARPDADRSELARRIRALGGRLRVVDATPRRRSARARRARA